MRTPTPDEPLRVVELFSGIGAQAMALKVAGIPHVVVGTSEIDAAAMRSYEAIHGPVPQLGDITELEELPDCDLVTYSFPCIRGDQLVRTGRGLVPIRDVREGDTVLTHRGRYMPVTCVRMTGIHGTMAVRTPMDTLVCTRDHMVLTRLRLGSHARASRENHTTRTFTAPYWCPAAALTGSNYVGYPISTKEEIPEWGGLTKEWSDGRVYRFDDISGMLDDPDFWYLCGRYVADGWPRSGGGIVIAVGKGKEPHIDRLTRLFHASVANERTVTKLHFPRIELEAFCEEMFGHGAVGKFIDQRVVDLPVGLLKAFLDGYVDGDGCDKGDCIVASSVSGRLIRDLQAVVAKVTHMCPKYSFTSANPTKTIEGREVHQRDVHAVIWNKTVNRQDKSFYEDGVIWMPVKEVRTLNPTRVYDIEVEEDHSFTASGMIVHNCQDLSVAGLRRGMDEGSGTRSALLWEVGRLLERAAERERERDSPSASSWRTCRRY